MEKLLGKWNRYPMALKALAKERENFPGYETYASHLHPYATYFFSILVSY